MIKLLNSITLIFSPYHVGIRGVAVGAGPLRLQSRGLIPALQSLGVGIQQTELEPVDAFDGEIGRSFELFRRTSVAVTKARDSGSFPIVVSGNCSASVGVWAGLHAATERDETKTRPGCIWFDAHDDYNDPDSVISGYFDSMPLTMMAGTSWKALLKTIPGFAPLNLDQLVHVGMRDVSELERARVKEARFDVVWGSTERKVDFKAELDEKLKKKGKMEEALVHLDLDSLDTSVGQANKFPAPGGLLEEELLGCLEKITAATVPLSLTVASYDPSYDPNDRISDAAIRAIKAFVGMLIQRGSLTPESR